MASVSGTSKALTDYPRPSVAVDVALLTVNARFQLCALVIRRLGTHRHDEWQLPGTFVHAGERLADAVRRALRTKVGVEGLEPVQLHVLDDPHRDDRGWVLSVAHLDVVAQERLAGVMSRDVVLAPVAGIEELAFDHDLILALAVEKLRADYVERPDPRRLLAAPFTLRELQLLHSAVAGTDLPKDSFRRRMEPLLEDTGEMQTGVVGKPARLFRHRRDRR